MKRPTLIVFLVVTQITFCQTGDWVWMNGSDVPNQPGIYGTQGVSSPSVSPPGVYEPVEWTDQQGNFWIMGGQNAASLNNDLWKYDKISGQWTWMRGSEITCPVGNYGTQGISSASNLPGGRGVCATSWTDSTGNLWLFGGWACWDATGTGNNIINDLWKYNISSNEWTWMKGSNVVLQQGVYGSQGVADIANTPGCRYETAASWTDSNGDLWFFGGFGKDATGATGYMSDIWKYDITSNIWIWQSGSNLANQLPVYGTKGVPSVSNTPGGRWIYSKWIDDSGNLWIFGGERASNLFYNDLWKYDVATNMWTWINGPTTTNDPGNYGDQCAPSGNNIPPARSENRACWKDNCGRFWMLGGTTMTWAANVNNDLWCYDPHDDTWTWVSGSNTPNQLGSYGSQGVPLPSNVPPSRLGAVAWKNGNDLWLFGGRNSSSFYNDFWKYTIDPACPACKVTNIEENDVNHFYVYPNPTSGIFNVSSGKQINHIEIFNFQGTMIFDQDINDSYASLDLSSFPGGIYFIRLIDEDNVILVQKLIIKDKY